MRTKLVMLILALLIVWIAVGWNSTFTLETQGPVTLAGIAERGGRSSGPATTAYTPNSRIEGKGSLSAPELFAAVHNKVPLDQRAEVWNYLRTLSALCDELGLDVVVLVAQWDLETDTGQSRWWRERKNPAGIGVTGSPAQNEASQTWADGEAAAFGHVAHMVAYVWGEEWAEVWPEEWPDPIELDQRFEAPIRAGYHADRLRDLNGTWAVDPQNRYHVKLAARANRLLEDAAAATSPRFSKP